MINVSVLDTTAQGTRWLPADLLPKTHKRTKSLDRVSTQSTVTGFWPVVSFLSPISYSRRTVKVKVGCCRPPKNPRLFQSKGRKNISINAGIDRRVSLYLNLNPKDTRTVQHKPHKPPFPRWAVLQQRVVY